MFLLAHFYFPIIYTYVYAKTTTQAMWTYHSLCTNTMREKYSSVKGKKYILSSQSVQQNVHRKQQQKSTAHFHISCLCLYFPTYTCELMGKGGGRELVIIFLMPVQPWPLYHRWTDKEQHQEDSTKKKQENRCERRERGGQQQQKRSQNVLRFADTMPKN